METNKVYIKTYIMITISSLVSPLVALYSFIATKMKALITFSTASNDDESAKHNRYAIRSGHFTHLKQLLRPKSNKLAMNNTTIYKKVRLVLQKMHHNTIAAITNK